MLQVNSWLAETTQVQTGPQNAFGDRRYIHAGALESRMSPEIRAQ
jgi:hypothetical protein